MILESGVFLFGFLNDEDQIICYDISTLLTAAYQKSVRKNSWIGYVKALLGSRRLTHKKHVFIVARTLIN